MSLDDQRDELTRILHSPQFRRAPKLQRFLEFICGYQFENRSHEINEFLIATEVFAKGPGFDPSQDSIVRVQAREARRRLREYYQQDGKDSRFRLEIPVGSYVPRFQAVNPPLVSGKAPSFNVMWLKAGAIALVVAAILLAADLGRRLERRVPSGPPSTAAALSPSLGGLWNRFVDSDAPTVLVLSNPTVTGCEADETPAGRARGAGTPQEVCPDEYTGMGEAVALYLITRIFEPARSKLTVKQARTLSPDEARRSNLILLGGKMVNPWTRTLGADLALTAESDGPLPGLSDLPAGRRYETVIDSRTGRLRKDRAVMALRRNASSGRWLLFLYGTHSQGTHAVAEAATNETFLSQLQWPPSVRPFPDNFQVYVEADVREGSRPVGVPLAVRVP